MPRGSAAGDGGVAAAGTRLAGAAGSPEPAAARSSGRTRATGTTVPDGARGPGDTTVPDGARGPAAAAADRTAAAAAPAATAASRGAVTAGDAARTAAGVHLDDLATVDLDIAALEEKYERPGGMGYPLTVTVG